MINNQANPKGALPTPEGVTNYIFIVGCDRTGTTLLVNILNNHPDICISSQMHYMGHLARPGLRQKMKNFGDLKEQANVRKLVKFLYQRPFAGGDYWHWLHKNVAPEVVEQLILEADQSERSLFMRFMALKAKGQPIQGEKTPDHIHYVSTLLKWFPQARIIHTFRDPRAIYVSELTKQQKRSYKNFPYKQIQSIKPLFSLYILLHMSLDWLLAVRYHHQFQKKYPNNYFLLRYEDLISDPETQIKKLCGFIGVEFQQEMLAQKVINTSFKTESGKQGFDQKALDRWRTYISPASQRWFLLWSKKYLKEFGYLE